MRTIIAIAMKELRIARRDKAGFFWRFGFPLLMSIFFGMIFGGGGGARGAMSLAVVDEDHTVFTADFIMKLHDSAEIDVVRTETGALLSREEAINRVRNGNVTAFLVLPKGMQDNRLGLMWGEAPELELGVDPSRSAEKGMLEGLLMAHFFQTLTGTFSDSGAMRGMLGRAKDQVRDSPDLDNEQRSIIDRYLGDTDRFFSEATWMDDDADSSATTIAAVSDKPNDEDTGGGMGSFSPVKIKHVDIAIQHEGPRSNYEWTFPQGMVWALIGSAAGFSVSLVIERRRGTLVRMQMAPVTRAHLLAGKALGCFIMIVGNVSALFVIGIAIFHIRPDSYPMLMLAIVCAACAFVGVMMLLSTLGKTEEGVAGIGWAVMMMMSMVGGGMIPLMFLPAWLGPVSSLSPVKWSIVAAEGAIWRGFSIAEMALPCGILVGVGIVTFALGALNFARNSVKE